MYHKCTPVLVCKFLIPWQNPKRYMSKDWKSMPQYAMVLYPNTVSCSILIHLFLQTCVGNLWNTNLKARDQWDTEMEPVMEEGARKTWVGAGARGAWELESGNDNVHGKSIVLRVPRRKKELSHKNGKWAPRAQSIRCQADRALKNEAIITGVHLTEPRWKSHRVMSALMHNQENSAWVMYRWAPLAHPAVRTVDKCGSHLSKNSMSV